MGGGLGGNEKDEADRLRKVFPKRLREALETRGISRRILAQAMGVHLNTIHAYASGQRFPRLSQLTLLAAALKVTVDWLLEVTNVQIHLDICEGHKPNEIENDIIYYVAIENNRDHQPSLQEICQAFEEDALRMDAHISRLQNFGLLLPYQSKDKKMILTPEGKRAFNAIDESTY